MFVYIGKNLANYEQRIYFFADNMIYNHNERGYLRDTCLNAQDKFKRYLDYFKVRY